MNMVGGEGGRNEEGWGEGITKEHKKTLEG